MNSFNVEENGKPLWSELPSLSVEKIYSFLNRNDQKSMSLVCRNWNHIYSSPSLWRKVIMCFPDVENKTEICPDVVFARRFGALFHHVDIFYLSSYYQDEPAYLLLSPPTILRQLKFFLQAVTRQSQLLSVAFLHVDIYVLRLDSADYADVCQTIVNFLKSQKRLQKVEFLHCRFKTAEAAEILKAIFVNNSKTLRYMHLPSFVLGQSCRELEENAVDDHLNFVALKNLEVLETDYTKIFEKMMLSFYEYRSRVGIKERSGRLKKIILICEDSKEIDYLRIHPEIWKYFKDFFPGLTVDLKIESACEPAKLSTFIVSHMPVRSLDFCLDFNPVPDIEVGTLLRHITSCNIGTSLEELTIFWNKISPNIAQDLIRFMNLCPALKILDLSIQHPVRALDTVFKSWLENKPVSLEIVKIIILGVHTAEDEFNQRMVYLNINDVYVPLLQPLKLGLLLF